MSKEEQEKRAEAAMRASKLGKCVVIRQDPLGAYVQVHEPARTSAYDVSFRDMKREVAADGPLFQAFVGQVLFGELSAARQEEMIRAIRTDGEQRALMILAARKGILR